MVYVGRRGRPTKICPGVDLQLILEVTEGPRKQLCESLQASIGSVKVSAYDTTIRIGLDLIGIGRD